MTAINLNARNDQSRATFEGRGQAPAKVVEEDASFKVRMGALDGAIDAFKRHQPGAVPANVMANAHAAIAALEKDVKNPAIDSWFRAGAKKENRSKESDFMAASTEMSIEQYGTHRDMGLRQAQWSQAIQAATKGVSDALAAVEAGTDGAQASLDAALATLGETMTQLKAETQSDVKITRAFDADIKKFDDDVIGSVSIMQGNEVAARDAATAKNAVLKREVAAEQGLVSSTTTQVNALALQQLLTDPRLESVGVEQMQADHAKWGAVKTKASELNTAGERLTQLASALMGANATVAAYPQKASDLSRRLQSARNTFNSAVSEFNRVKSIYEDENRGLRTTITRSEKQMEAAVASKSDAQRLLKKAQGELEAATAGSGSGNAWESGTGETAESGGNAWESGNENATSGTNAWDGDDPAEIRRRITAAEGAISDANSAHNAAARNYNTANDRLTEVVNAFESTQQAAKRAEGVVGQLVATGQALDREFNAAKQSAQSLPSQIQAQARAFDTKAAAYNRAAQTAGAKEAVLVGSDLSAAVTAAAARLREAGTAQSGITSRINAAVAAQAREMLN